MGRIWEARPESGAGSWRWDGDGVIKYRMFWTKTGARHTVPLRFFSRIFLVFGGKRGSVRRRISGPTARDSLAQPNGLGLNVVESSRPTVRDPDQSHTYRSS